MLDNMKVKIINILFFTIALKGLAVGSYHLYLPTHWQWQKGLANTPEILQWALLSLNDLWSVVMILLHGALLISFKATFLKQNYQLGFFLALYWLIHGVIITLNPMPLPSQLAYLTNIFLLIPFIQFLVLTMGAYSARSIYLKNNQITSRLNS